MKKINAPSFPGSFFLHSFFLILKHVLCSAAKLVQFAKILDKIVFYSTLPARAAGPLCEGERAGRRGCPQHRPCPHLLSRSFHTRWAETGAGNGAHDGPPHCEGMGQAGGPAGGSRPEEAGVRPPGEAGHPYGLLVPAGP